MSINNNEVNNSPPFQYYYENISSNVDSSQCRISDKRKLKVPIVPPDSYTSRISCPTRREYYKNLENERRNREYRGINSVKPVKQTNSVRQARSPNPEEMSRSIISTALKQASEIIQQRQRRKISSAPTRMRNNYGPSTTGLQQKMSNVPDVYQGRTPNDERRSRCRHRMEEYTPEIKMIPMTGASKRKLIAPSEDSNNIQKIGRDRGNALEGPPTLIFRPLTHRRTLYLVQSRTMHMDIKPKKTLSDNPYFHSYNRRSNQGNDYAPRNKRNYNNNMQNNRNSISRMPDQKNDLRKRNSRTEGRYLSKVNPITTSHSVAINKSNSNNTKFLKQNMTMSNFTLLNSRSSFNRNLSNENGVPIEKNSLLTDRKNRLNEKLNRYLAQNSRTLGPITNKMFKPMTPNRGIKRPMSPVRRNMGTPLNKLGMNLKPLPINLANLNQPIINLTPKIKTDVDTMNLTNRFFNDFGSLKDIPTCVNTFKSQGQIGSNMFNLTLKGDSKTEVKTNETYCQT